MAFDQMDAPDGRKQGARPRIGLIYFAATGVVSLVFAGVSLLLMAVVVALVAGDQEQSTKVAVVIAGATVGAVAGSWMSQPRLAKQVSALVEARQRAKD